MNRMTWKSKTESSNFNNKLLEIWHGVLAEPVKSQAHLTGEQWLGRPEKHLLIFTWQDQACEEHSILLKLKEDFREVIRSSLARG